MCCQSLPMAYLPTTMKPVMEIRAKILMGEEGVCKDFVAQEDRSADSSVSGVSDLRGVQELPGQSIHQSTT